MTPLRSVLRRMQRGVKNVDVILSALGVLFGAASLTFPFGRDQGIYAYIGREWLHGRLPYQSSFDVKTPGIFAIHAVIIAVLGERAWGIRLMELGCVVVLGLLSARFIVPRGKNMLPGMRGSGVLAVSIFYYGYFNFWDTGQCELWCITFATGSLVAVRAIAVDVDPLLTNLRRAAIGGLLAVVSLLVKPPALWFVALALFLLIKAGTVRSEAGDARRVPRTLALLGVFGLGPVLTMAVILSYFAAHGALRDLYDILVVNNRHYVLHGRWVNSAHDVVLRIVGAFNIYNPAAILLLDALVLGTWMASSTKERPTWRVHILAFVAVGCVVAAVTMQLKFCFYHWGLVVGPAGAAVALLTFDLHVLWQGRVRPWVPGTVTGAVLFVAFLFCGEPARRWLGDGKAALAYATGRLDDASLYRRFDLKPPMPFSAQDTREIALWVKAHSNPGDTIAVRGFEPQIYLTAERSFPGRFFWTTFLVTPAWSYRLDDWVEEDRQVFVKTPPRFVLALSFAHTGVDSAEYFLPLGYERRETIHAYVVLEHTGHVASVNTGSP